MSDDGAYTNLWRSEEVQRGMEREDFDKTGEEGREGQSSEK